jgi:hypothetical protein
VNGINILLKVSYIFGDVFVNQLLFGYTYFLFCFYSYDTIKATISPFLVSFQ